MVSEIKRQEVSHTADWDIEDKGILKKTMVKMAAKQSMTQTEIQAPIMVIIETDNLVNNARPVQIVSRLGDLVIK